MQKSSTSSIERLVRCARAALLVLACSTAPVHAVDFTVNAATDGVDVAPGNGVCATSTGVCTLRAALMEANALAGPDRLLLAGRRYELTLIGAGNAAGSLDVTSAVEIVGNGSSIVALPGIDRALEVTAGSVTLDDLALAALGATASPQCVLAQAPVVANRVDCRPGIGFGTFETGDLSQFSSHSP